MNHMSFYFGVRETISFDFWQTHNGTGKFRADNGFKQSARFQKCSYLVWASWPSASCIKHSHSFVLSGQIEADRRMSGPRNGYFWDHKKFLKLFPTQMK